jgi:hypothetical protein
MRKGGSRMLVFWNDNFVGIYQGSTRVSCPPACPACSLAGDREASHDRSGQPQPRCVRRRHAGFGRAGELRSPDASAHIVPRLRRKSSRRTALACSHSNTGSALRTLIRLSHSPLVGAKAQQARHRTRRNHVAGRSTMILGLTVTAFLLERPRIPDGHRLSKARKAGARSCYAAVAAGDPLAGVLA